MSSTPVPAERRQLRRRATDQARTAPSCGPLPGDEPWRSCDDLLGATLHTPEGPLGVVTDLVVEEDSWAVTGLLVDADTVVPLAEVARIDWPQRALYLKTPI